MSRAAGGRPAGGADARRDRAEGPLLRRRAGHHDRRHQGPARAVGRLDGEQDRHRAPARRPRRPRPGCRAGRARRPRRQPRRCARPSTRCSAPCRCSAASATRSETCSSTCPSATAPRSRHGCAARGPPTTTSSRSTACARSPTSSSAPIPAPPRRCARAWRRRSPSPGCGIRGRLKRTLQLTNPIESMIEIVRRTSRNVKRWQSGDMCLRWTAAGMLEAEQQFRKIIGYSDLAKLAIAVERDLAAQRDARSHHDHPGGRYARHRLTITGTAVTKFHDGRDNLGPRRRVATPATRPFAPRLSVRRRTAHDWWFWFRSTDGSIWLGPAPNLRSVPRASTGTGTSADAEPSAVDWVSEIHRSGAGTARRGDRRVLRLARARVQSGAPRPSSRVHPGARATGRVPDRPRLRDGKHARLLARSDADR